MTYTNGDAQCTANFIHRRHRRVPRAGRALRRHRLLSTEVNGCEAPSLPLGTPVEIEGADNPGTLAYSS
ncbi:hypothetical protein HBB16_17200 [Pseudonocardia sp. MCCB 268]|nr:hypothetical protein [Pseudonocardia cytotoxica]